MKQLILSEQNHKLAIIIVAAGNSSRLGQTKQLVKRGNINLLQQTIHLAKQTHNEFVCILGHNADGIIEKTKIEDRDTLINVKWRQGMGTSIAIGVTFFMNKVDGILILLCDQYRLKPEDIQKLVQAWNNHPQHIIASQYFEKQQGSIIQGAPAIFPKRFFPQLMTLKEKGARHLIIKNQSDVIPILLENAAFDLDTKDDLEEMLTTSTENYND